MHIEIANNTRSNVQMIFGTDMTRLGLNTLNYYYGLCGWNLILLHRQILEIPVMTT